jgi:hypothetical protein
MESTILGFRDRACERTREALLLHGMFLGGVAVASGSVLSVQATPVHSV